ncbi:MAG: hypothetical protein RR259_05745 [Odoribacter sp.]
MKKTEYNKLVLTAIATVFLMLVVLIGMIKAQPTVSCSAIGGIMTVLTAYLWRTE